MHFLTTLAKLGLSLALSRILSIGSLLIFSMLSGPEPFAAFGLYMGIVTILWVIVSGCYEQAILVAPSTREAHLLARLSVMIATVVCGIILIAGVIAIVTRLPLPAALSQFPVVIMILPFALALRFAHRLVLLFATRQGHFTPLAHGNWIQAGVQATLLLGLVMGGISPLTSLVVADMAGLFAATVFMIHTSCNWRAFWHNPFSLQELKQAAQTWHVMPLWRLPMSLISVIALNIPTIMVSLMYPATIAGQLVFALRILETPSNIVTGAVSPMLQRHMAITDNPRQFAIRAVALLSLFAVIAFGILGILAWIAQPWFNETRWALSVESVPWLALYFAGLTISAPLVGTVIGLHVEKRAAIFQGIFLLVTLLASTLMIVQFSWQIVLAAYGFAMLTRACLFSGLLIEANVEKNKNYQGV